MGKRKASSLIMMTAMVLGLGLGLGYVGNANADIQWLPKYQAKFAQKRTVDSDNPILPDPLSCEAKGWVSEIPANQTCSPKYLVGGKKCWSDCKCEAKYKYAQGKGVANGCPNGKTVNTDVCNGLYSGCVDCSTNTQVSAGWGTTYKSGSNVAVMTNYGTCANYYYSCNSGYTPAKAASNAYLHSGPWTWISCGTNQKAVNQDGSTGTPKLCQKCMPKVCADYNSGYVPSDDETMDCTKIDRTKVDGLDCWSCAPCSSDYKYDASNCPSPKILGTGVCNGKASTCACPAVEPNPCSNGCETPAPSGCTGCLKCKSCPNLGKYTTSQCSAIGASVSSGNYESCSEKYTCCTGTAGSCPSGFVCDTSGKVCSGQHIAIGCQTGLVNVDACYNSGGVNYGPPSMWTAKNMGL